MKKLFTTLLTTIFALILAIPAFATNNIVIKNYGTSLEPYFVTANDNIAFCLEKNVKSADATGVSYKEASLETKSQVKNIVANFLEKEDTSKETVAIAQFAIWGTIENSVESFNIIVKAKYGDDAVALFNELINATPEVDVDYTFYKAAGYQNMISGEIVEKVPETIIPEAKPEPKPQPKPQPEETIKTKSESVTEPVENIVALNAIYEVPEIPCTGTQNYFALFLGGCVVSFLAVSLILLIKKHNK